MCFKRDTLCVFIKVVHIFDYVFNFKASVVEKIRSTVLCYVDSEQLGRRSGQARQETKRDWMIYYSQRTREHGPILKGAFLFVVKEFTSSSHFWRPLPARRGLDLENL